MNAKHGRELLTALAACDPGGAFAGVQEAIARVADGAPGVRWEISVRGGDAPAVKAAAAGAAKPGKRFSPAAFEEPVASALKTFAALCPVSEMRLGPGGAWSLTLERPVPWPAFLRCDLSAAFVPRAAQWSLVLRDARVAALDFDGEALWARCSG